jgi:hypothetical protein
MSTSDPTVTDFPQRGDPHTRLARALDEAARADERESPEVCAAVEQVVEEAKSAGQPPERVLVMLKTLAYRVVDAARLSGDAVRALIAWVVRCAVKAYYRGA